MSQSSQAGAHGSGAKTAAELPTLRIFLSSPGDVAEERALAQRAFRRLEIEFAYAVQLEFILWEHEPLFAHTGFQQQIPRPSQCDLVISVLWARLGTRLPADFVPRTDAGAITGTEFEIEDALESYRRMGRPNLLIYRKTARPQVDLTNTDAEERLLQYRRLQEFCQRAFYDSQGTAVVATHEFAQAHEFERKLYEHIRRWLERKLGTDLAARARWTAGSPYRGLQAFHAEHRDIYFGRSQAVSELMGLLRATESRSAAGEKVVRWLLIQGMSGNGKSSLVRAGVLPLLQGRALEGIGLWLQAIVKPSDRLQGRMDLGPVGALAAALSQSIVAVAKSYPDAVTFAERLRSAPAEAAARLEGYLTQEALQRGLQTDQVRLVVYIDQLEELFGQSFAEGDRMAFVAVLLALAREGRIWVLASIRSDFSSRIEEYSDLLALAGAGHLYILGPPQPDELADMITEPAKAAGLQWESRDGVSLDQAVLRQAIANPESLPLLEYALDQLYERQVDGRLNYAAYEALGGLKGAISQSAEAVLTARQSLAPAFPKLMRSLASVDESGSAVRRYAPLAELAPGSPERELLDALLERRLCVADWRGEAAVASFSHEALIQSWPRVTEWLRREAGLLQTRDLALHETRQWQQHGESDAWLASADKLLAFRALEAADIRLPTATERFIAGSQRRVRVGRRIRQLAVIGIIALALTSTIFGLYAQSARSVASHAIANQFESKAWELLNGGNLESALRYALASTLIAKPAKDSPPLLTAGLLQAHRTLLLSGHTDHVRGAAFSPDGHTVVTASEDHTARVWDTGSGHERLRLLHDAKVWQASYSSDGRYIATASGDNVARIWDAGSGALINKFEHGEKNTSSVLQVVFSPNAPIVATVSSDGTAWIWDLASGQTLARLQDGIGMLDMVQAVQANVVSDLQHSKIVTAVPVMTGIRSLAFSPDGREVVTASTVGAARVWSVASGQTRLKLKHDDVVIQADFSADGRRIMTASKDHTARLWEAQSGRELARFGHDAAVVEAAFSPDGREVVTASDDGTARVWDATDGTEVARARYQTRLRRDSFLTPDVQRMKLAIARATNHLDDIAGNRELARLHHDGRVSGARFSPDARLVVTTSDDRTARVWDSATGSELARLQHNAPVEAATFSASGAQLITTALGNNAQLWDLGRILGVALPHEADVLQASFSRDGRLVLTASLDHTARVWNIESQQQIARFNCSEGVQAAVLSADGSRALTVTTEAIVWDVASGREITRLRHSIANVRQAVFSPDGTRVLTAGGTDYSARLWDAATGREMLRFNHDGVVNAVAFSPDGVRALTSSGDHTARIWDLATGNELLRLKHTEAVRQATYSTDGQRIVTASDDHSAKIWDAFSGRDIAQLWHDQHDGVVVRQAGFSADGTRVLTASSDHTARVWDSRSGRELARLRHENAVLSAAFFADGRHVLTASSDHTARIWDVTSGHELFLLQRATYMRQAAIAPDGRRALTAADDAARLWDVSTLAIRSQELKVRDCSWLPTDQRHFAPEEIQADALIRDVFLAGAQHERSVCEGSLPADVP